MQADLIILKLSIVLIVGFIGSLLAKKLKLPSVSGYLVLGLLLGPSLGLIFNGFEGIITLEENQMLSFIGEIALGFIALSIGSEFTLKTIRKMGRTITTLTVFEVLGAVIVVFVAMLLVPKPDSLVEGYQIFDKTNIAFALVLASMSVATAPAATLMVMRQYRAYGPVTKAILPITALDDVFGIIIFGFVLSVAKMLLPTATVQPLAIMIFKPFIEVLGSLFFGFALGLILSKLANKFDRLRDDIQIVAIMTIFFALGIINYVNGLLVDSSITFSFLLTSIMIGAVLSNMARKPERTYSSINDLSTPFYVLFFTLAGASLDLGILKSEILILVMSVVYIIARGVGKIGGIRVGAHIVDAPDVIKKYLGFGLLPQGGISIGLLVIVSAQLKSLYPTISAIILLSILVYETFGPLFAKYAISKAGEINGLDALGIES